MPKFKLQLKHVAIEEQEKPFDACPISHIWINFGKGFQYVISAAVGKEGIKLRELLNAPMVGHDYSKGQQNTMWTAVSELLHFKAKVGKANEDLIPPDRERCQAEVPNGANCFTVGGRPETIIRCSNKPTVIAIENEAGTDGRIGSMSLCETCKEHFISQLGNDYARFEVIHHEDSKNV